MNDNDPTTRYRITVTDVQPDGTTSERIDGVCDAFVLAITADPNGELRILTDHHGPLHHRRTALKSLTAHIDATNGLQR
ncbi:MAG: hypothetical protein M3Y91_16035 [Actinomycetota bacterium]|nr:hypothetical protein [Actinomycetota bacterium]